MKGDVQRRKLALHAQIDEQQMNHERCLLNQAKPTQEDDDAAFNLTQRTVHITEPRSQYYGGGLDLVGCSESIVEDQLADDEVEGSQFPRSFSFATVSSSEQPPQAEKNRLH
ncbi:hypothetical protein FMEXI_1642 [Fusarium mexicanum]|uniref:Uncharacterized protein n=1 Tax=Fusarium mexicanum TaxID=751941 RepID=A0A8H5JHW0_9HYPO|nr:hypothetical protein FMEXI_1642 [Fusarium mexicanum]